MANYKEIVTKAVVGKAKKISHNDYSLKTEEITELSTIALAEFTEDGEAEVEAEAKKKEDQETK